MDEGMRDLIDRMDRGEQLTDVEYGEIVRFRDDESVEYISQCAQRKKARNRRDDLGVVGTIDLTSYCKNDCYYCSLRRENRFADRYRMNAEDVLDCMERGLDHGITAFLIQGGEDLQYTADDIVHIISVMKHRLPEVELYLSLGEKSRNVYQKWKKAGAVGYLLCHQAAEDSYYKKLHPANMSLLKRKQCLWELKELGYQVGCGFMIGSPYQRIADLAAEFPFLRQLMPQMVMVGPFLPADSTPFEAERNGGADLTCFVLSMLRLLLPNVFLPVAQTLELLDKEGAVHAARAGADLLLADLTPELMRFQYHDYKKRLQRGDVSADSLIRKKRMLREAGYEITADIKGI